jgi:hypothetical protein
MKIKSKRKKLSLSIDKDDELLEKIFEIDVILESRTRWWRYVIQTGQTIFIG